MHRNVTFRRMVLDFYQLLRAQNTAMHIFGPQFTRNPLLVEIDITYRCNLRCNNCNRSCAQAPSRIDMPLATINTFLEQSTDQRVEWKRIRLLGGEPTLHPQLDEILQILLNYKYTHNPGVRIVICTNGSGKLVKQRLDGLPSGVAIKSTAKGKRQRLLRPFNIAPVDIAIYRFADYHAGCRIIWDCGLGLTPSGYYQCAVAGGIDRIFKFDAGRSHLPAANDDMRDLMNLFCRYCGHFGFSWPTRRQKMSSTWTRAYRTYNKRIKH
jgi:hypothetical protein